MKIIVKYLWLSLMGVIMVACDKNDRVGPEYVENLYRVNQITGHNAPWGDFKISLQYEKNKFEKGLVLNSQNDTVGKLDRLVDSRSQMDVFRVSARVPALSQEEIEELPQGSAIPMTWLTVYEVRRDLRKEIISSYEYKDKEFKVLPQKTYMYEYEDSLAVNPKVLKWRGYENEENLGGLRKMTYSYEGNRIRSGEYAEYVTNWSTTAGYTYTYEGDRLVSLVGKTLGGQTVLDKKFTYNGTQLKVVAVAGVTTREVTYTLDSEGYVTRIDEGNGNYMDVKYESGHGDFSYFIPLTDKLEGNPYIK